MIEDEAAPRRKDVTIPRPLAGLSIAELEDHIAGLRAEIVRTEAEIARQKAIRGAAEAFFKKPG